MGKDVDPENVDATLFADVIEVFLTESEERLSSMEEGLLRLESRPDDDAAIALVFRSVHTIKGNAGAFGYNAVVTLAHVAEDMLQDLRDGRIHATSDLVTLLLRSVDALRALMARGAGAELTAAHQELLARLADARADGADSASAAPPPIVANPSPTNAPPESARTLRVDTERLDQLLSLTGEIAVSRARLSQMLQSPDAPRRALQESHRDSERLYLDLQDLVMKLRMVPVGPSFQQLARLVRDMARKLSREARLEITGGNVEIDNTVLQLLRDPLTHMVRNALDHGIEAPAAREARGKPRSGRISLRCSRETSDVVIELADDGAGIDRERVLARARERGVLGEDAAPPDAQLFPLLFEPGFSTTEAVSDISGRGVGLDVVRRNIHALRGSVSVASQLGAGTTFTIRLPLTLAIIDGLLVRVGATTCVLPVENIRESRSMPADEAHRRPGRGVVNLRDRPLPFVRLRHVFRIEDSPPDREVLIVMAGQSGPVGLVVDAMSGEGQVVIKPLSKVFQSVNGVAATTVLADGQVALILDAGALLRTCVPQRQTASAAGVA
ncbi:MAG: chemotaxis protein CheA [Vicinamibacteria bacterium]|nr:chemotaxis protein CheA [Vicinamibacteria bacterium]